MNNVLEWLKENDNLAIKYRTMTEIYGKSFEENKEDYETDYYLRLNSGRASLFPAFIRLYSSMKYIFQ